MDATTPLITFILSLCLAAYLYYGIVRVPDDIEKRDEIMWIYAKRKYTRALSITGEYLGLGNRVVLSRTIAPLLSSQAHVNKTGVKIYNSDFDGVNVRVYEPHGKVVNGPAMLWIHGGGWVTRTVESDDKVASELARRLDIMLFSIDYRLAPEYPFPAGLDDCVAATKYLMENADTKFKVNRKRIVIAGASAGGNLAAAVALKLRDDNSPYQLQQQVLVVPCLQAFDFNTPSYQMNSDNAFLPKDWMIHYWMLYGLGPNGTANIVSYASTNDHTSEDAKNSHLSAYVNHDFIGRKYIHQSYTPNKKDHGESVIWNKIKDVMINPYFAPLMSANLAHLPEAYIITAQYDVLRDDGIMYAKRLLQAGSKATLKNYDRTYHAAIEHFDHISISKELMNDLVHYLGKNL